MINKKHFINYLLFSVGLTVFAENNLVTPIDDAENNQPPTEESTFWIVLDPSESQKLPWALLAFPEYLGLAELALEANPGDLNELDDEGHTPLIWALLKGNGVLAEILLRKGANPNITGNNFIGPVTPWLLMASLKDESQAIELLNLSAQLYGIENIDEYNSFGAHYRTPLQLSLFLGKKNIYKTLLQLGANPMKAFRLNSNEPGVKELFIDLSTIQFKPFSTDTQDVFYVVPASDVLALYPEYAVDVNAETYSDEL